LDAVLFPYAEYRPVLVGPTNKFTIKITPDDDVVDDVQRRPRVRSCDHRSRKRDDSLGEFLLGALRLPTDEGEGGGEEQFGAVRGLVHAGTQQPVDGEAKIRDLHDGGRSGLLFTSLQLVCTARNDPGEN
jgi:hypothetical protein